MASDLEEIETVRYHDTTPLLRLGGVVEPIQRNDLTAHPPRGIVQSSQVPHPGRSRVGHLLLGLLDLPHTAPTGPPAMLPAGISPKLHAARSVSDPRPERSA